MPDIFQHEFAGNTEQLEHIRHFVADTVKNLGASDEDIFACQLSADEAASNAFEHAYAGKGGRVEIRISREGDQVVITLRDWGEPFDPAQIPEPDVDARLEERNVGGLGMFLIRKLMDDVSFSFDPLRGNEITLRRVLSRAGLGEK